MIRVLSFGSVLCAAICFGGPREGCAAVKTRTVACPGICLISPNVGDCQARHQSVVHCFVRDLLRDADEFRFMTDARAGAIFTQIKSGALDYGTDDLCEIFAKFYLPADIVIDCRVLEAKPYTPAKVRVSCHSREAGRKERTFTCRNDAGMSVDILPQLADWIVEASPGLAPETAARFRKFAKDRAPWAGYYYLAQVCQNEPATCSGGAQRYGWLLGAQKNAKGNDPVLSAGYAEAGYYAVHCRLKPRPPLTIGKIVGVGANAVNYALGGPDEERLAVFVCDSCCPGRTVDELRGFVREIAADADGRFMESEMDEADLGSDDVAADLSSVVAGKKLSPAQAEARGRGALWLLAQRREPKFFADIARAASASSAATRRAAAAAFGCYARPGENPPREATKPLEKLAKDGDPSVAVAAIASLRAFGVRPPSAVAVARRLLDAETVTEGVIGLRAEAQALAILAAEGDATDEARIRPRLRSGKVPVRREAVRALLSKCPFGEGDFAAFADPDHTVGQAALEAVPLERLAKDEKLAAAVRKATGDFCGLVANAASARLAEAWKRAGVAVDADRMTLATSHPYFRRKLVYRLADDPSAKATDLIVEATANAHAQTRALALRVLSHRDAEKGRAAALRLAGDPHTWVRCRAGEVLSRLAQPADAAAVRAQLAKERNRVAKLYFADALAKAEGRPLPPPLPSVNTILDGECRNWHCFLSDQCDKSSFNAYYTCDVPKVPTPQVKYAHDVLKKPIYPRPRPTENPFLILTDNAVTDDFWTELDREMPDEVICCVDGVVYGEETMHLSPDDEASWTAGWQIFCTEAGIDPHRVAGRRENLMEDERLAWYDWAEKTGVEGFNELYDFTHFYFGKLRPGLQVASFCVHYADSISRWQSRWKCDVPGNYIYSGDVRRMYAALRWFRTVWPGRPNLWLSGGHVSGDDWNGPATWQSYFAPRPLAFRWDNAYAANLAAYLAGSETGYFSSYGIKNPDEVAARGGPHGFCAEEIWPPSDPAAKAVLDAQIKFGFNKVERYLRDEMNQAKRAAADPNDLEGDEGSEDALTLEEVGGKDDPAMVALAKLKERAYWGLLYEHKFLQDTSRALVGLRRRTVGNAQVLMMASALKHKPGLTDAAESPFGCWFDDFDVQHNFEMAAHHPHFFDYRVISLGQAQQEYMNEETRRLWIRWLTETSGLLVVNGWMDPGVKMAQRSVDCLKGDLKTPWPWQGDLAHVPEVPPAKNAPGVPARYEVANASRCTVLETDGRGEAVRVLWRHPQLKAAVVFDLLKGNEKAAEARALMVKFFADAKVDLKIPEVDRRLWSDENGLRVEVRGWGCTKTNRYAGCELVTGQWNPTVSAQLNAAMVAEEYAAPYVAVHGGVCILSQSKLNILEKTPHGFRLKPAAGLLRITTKSGRLAKITTASGKPPPPYRGDVAHWYVGRTLEEGLATLPAIRVDPAAPVWHFSGGVWDPKLKTIADREDDIPPYQLLRSSEAWVLVEDEMCEVDE